ncbi:MAG: SusC/RagA family TonB-linked outer membrane protein [Bacteroidales bacterium]|nr:SusC/RagA family TonB-linked outer membrane protein [Bacteroidales bacterium]
MKDVQKFHKKRYLRIFSSAWVLLFIVQVAFHMSYVQAQTVEHTVNGVVSDESGNGIFGATVAVRGTSIGTITDADGKFKLKVPNNSNLTISFTGYEPQQVNVRKSNNLVITLKESYISLNEVVTVGYGKQSRATVTSSISKVQAKDLSMPPVGNPLSLLQGKVAGLEVRVSSGQPGSDPQLILRGGTSTSPESDNPLVIIDGVIRNMKDVNTQNIETIEVLKDAASTAIYGARANNGIVVITTKQGKPGKGKINVRYGLNVDDQPKRYPLSTARDYLYVSRLSALHALNPQNYLTGSFAMSTANPRNSLNTTAFLDDYINNYGQDYVDDLLNNKGWETMEDPVNPGKMLIFKDTDFQSRLFQTAVGNDINIDFSGGNDKSTYFASAGYLNQPGIVKGTDYTRMSLLFNGSYKIRDNFKSFYSINYSFREFIGLGNSENSVMSRAARMPRTVRDYYEDGTPAQGENRNDFRTRDHELYYRTNLNHVSRINISTGFDWEIIPDLKFEPVFSFYNNEGLTNNFEKANQIFADRRASAEHNMDLHFQYDATLTYSKSIEKNNFSAMLGLNYTNDPSFSMSGSGYGAPTDYIPTLNATTKESQTVSTTYYENKMASVFGRVTYDYNKRYLFSASLRKDGSSRFAANHRFGIFPGASAGWNMHEEEFFTPVKKLINNLKIRASWGKTGNNDLSLADTEGQYKPGYAYDGDAGLLNTVLANNNLLWETTASTDLGFDLGMFNSRLNVLFDVYSKITSDRLMSKTLWAESGFASIKSNYGEMKSKGVEFEISGTPVKTKNFTWTSSFNFAFNRSVCGKLPYNGQYKNRTNGGIIYDTKLGKYVYAGGFAEGERPGSRFAFQSLGVYATDEEAADAPYDELVAASSVGLPKVGGDTKWRDVDGNDTINYKDLVFVGYIHPDRIGGFTNTFNYKGLTLRVVTDFSMGNVIDNMFRGGSNSSGRNNIATMTDVTSKDIWKKQGDIATIPRYDVESDWDFGKRNHARPNSPTIGFSKGTVNTLYIKKGDYLAFREVSLSYALRGVWLEKIKVSGIDLSLAVYNLGYLTAYDGLTPEVIGADAGKYPRPRSVVFTTNLSF